MPNEKAARRCRESAQGPAHHSACKSTRTRSSTTATPSTSQVNQPQSDPLTDQSLSDLLDLVRQQVRAEMQAAAGQDESTSSVQQPPATSQPTAVQPTAGTFLYIRYILPGSQFHVNVYHCSAQAT